MENQNIIAVESFDGKYRINEFYRPIAEALQKKYKELQYALVKNILFIENMDDKRKKNNKVIYAQISKIPGKWEELVYQMTKKRFEYMLEVFKENIWELDRAQIVALIYHELKHIQMISTGDGPKIDIVGHDVEDWSNMIEKLGVDWAKSKGYVPDLLEDGVNWESIEGPASLFPAEASLKLVK